MSRSPLIKEQVLWNVAGNERVKGTMKPPFIERSITDQWDYVHACDVHVDKTRTNTYIKHRYIRIISAVIDNGESEFLKMNQDRLPSYYNGFWKIPRRTHTCMCRTVIQRM